MHVLGSGSAERPPEDLVSSVRFSSPDADPDVARSMLGSHTIAIGESAMAQYRMHGDGLPCLVAHELGHAAQRTAAVCAHSTGEGRGAQFTQAAVRHLQAHSDVLGGGLTYAEALRGLKHHGCRSPAELEADLRAHVPAESLERHLAVARTSEPFLRASERHEGHADDFAHDVVLATYPEPEARALLGAVANQRRAPDPFSSVMCEAWRNDTPQAVADPDRHRPLRSHPARLDRADIMLGRSGEFNVPLAPDSAPPTGRRIPSFRPTFCSGARASMAFPPTLTPASSMRAPQARAAAPIPRRPGPPRRRFRPLSAFARSVPSVE